MDKPFVPTGQLILVNGSATQVGNFGLPGSCWRVRNLSGSAQYFTWGQTSSVSSNGAPSAGSPSFNTIGMVGNSVEVFSGIGPYMIASSATGFEVQQGDGI